VALETDTAQAVVLSISVYVSTIVFALLTSVTFGELLRQFWRQ